MELHEIIYKLLAAQIESALIYKDLLPNLAGYKML